MPAELNGTMGCEKAWSILRHRCKASAFGTQRPAAWLSKHVGQCFCRRLGRCVNSYAYSILNLNPEVHTLDAKAPKLRCEVPLMHTYTSDAGCLYVYPGFRVYSTLPGLCIHARAYIHVSAMGASVL